MVEIKGLDVGPYAPGQEARFKKDTLARWTSGASGWEYFCIESPGTADGFPDVLGLRNNCYMLTEFKVSDKRGVVTFEKTQPLFYRKHEALRISILAYDVPRQRVVEISPQEVVAAKSLKFKITEG